MRVTIDEAEGIQVLKARSGDRYMVRLRVHGPKGTYALIQVYFADLLHLPELTKVDVSPDEPNPPMWEYE